MSSESNITDFTGEMLTPEEFAERMNVCRTIIYQMICDNRLRSGRHYIQLNTKKRFPWGSDLIRKLLDDSVDFGTNRKVQNPKRIKETMSTGTLEQTMKTKSKNLPFINLN